MTDNKVLEDLYTFFVVVNCLLFIIAISTFARFMLIRFGQGATIIAMVILVAILAFAFSRITDDVLVKE